MVSRETIDGRTILTVVLRDITERKELEELRESVAREMDHRMRNVLSVVNSLVSLSAANAVNVEEFKEPLMGRLRALAATQSALRFGEQQSTSLREILQSELVQYQTTEGTNLIIEGPPVSVGPRAAQILALAIHELATNSTKYWCAPQCRRARHSHLGLQRNGRPTCDPVAGNRGPLVEPPKRKGFGMDLIKQLVGRALRGEIDVEYRKEGLACRMTLPRATVEAGSAGA